MHFTTPWLKIRRLVEINPGEFSTKFVKRIFNGSSAMRYVNFSCKRSLAKSKTDFSAPHDVRNIRVLLAQ